MSGSDQDSQVIALLCSNVGLADSEARPLGAREWNDLGGKVRESSLATPGALLGLSADELMKELSLSPEESGRIVRLLDRDAAWAIEIERLAARGIFAVTQSDQQYPSKFFVSLKSRAPALLFYSGELEMLNQSGRIAVVGSRQLDDPGREFAIEIGRKCAECASPLVSGGARGTDAIAMEAAMEAGGVAIGVLADSLEKTIRMPDVRERLAANQLLLVTPFSPSAGFSVGAAMGRNRVIYGLADYAVIVASEIGKGGTWAGATEALRFGLCPIFARMSATAPAGNAELLKKGAREFLESQLGSIDDLRFWLDAHATPVLQQPSLFGEPG